MRLRKSKIHIVLITIIILIFTPVAGVKANNCTPITTLPRVISVSGNYCLISNLTASNTGIAVFADNVVIDFDGHSIFGSQSPNNVFLGIYANNRSNITIKNGEIVGFFYAIRIADIAYGLDQPYTTGWHTVEDMQISRSTFKGISLQGVSNIIRNNDVSHIQGNTFYADSFAIAIENTGQGGLIQNNFIYETRGLGSGEGVAISVSDAGSGGSIIGNVITNISVEENNQTDWSGLSSSTFGIWVGGNSSVVIQGNIIQNMMYGIVFSSPVQPSLIDHNIITDAYSPITANPSDVLNNNICDMICTGTYTP